MARASGACHVAEITRTHGGRRYRYDLLRRTYRQDGQVKHETLGNLSRLPAATIALIRRAVRGEALVAPTTRLTSSAPGPTATSRRSSARRGSSGSPRASRPPAVGRGISSRP